MALTQQQLARANEVMARNATLLQEMKDARPQLMVSWEKEAAPFSSAAPNGVEHQGRALEALINRI